MILTRKNWIIVILSTVVFFPVSYYLFNSSSEAQRIMHLIVFFQSLVLYSFNLKINKKSQKLLFLFILFSVSFIFFLVNYIKTITSFSLNDLSDIFRIVFICNYLVLGYVISKSLNFESIISYLNKLFKIQIISSLLIFIPPLYFLLDIFKGRPSYQEFNFHFYRTSGTFIYPSDFSFIIGFFAFYFFYKYVFENKYKLSLLISLVLILSSVSRGAILSYGLFIPLIPIIFYKNIFSFSKKIYPFYLVLFFISFVSLFFFNNEYLDYVVNSASYIFSGEGSIDSSTLHRFNELTLAFNYANDNFPFGLGPSRSLISEKIDVIESFYGYYLIKWGYLGLSFMLIFYFYILCIMFKRYNYFRLQSNFSIAGLYFSFISITVSFLLFFGWSSAITERFKLMPFYFILCGFLIASNKSR